MTAHYLHLPHPLLRLYALYNSTLGSLARGGAAPFDPRNTLGVVDGIGGFDFQVVLSRLLPSLARLGFRVLRWRFCSGRKGG